MTLRGRCLCGDIRYQLDRVPAVMGVCHCKRCQRQGGSAFSTMAGVPREAFTLLRGDPAIYRGGTDSGGTGEIFFCGRCGSPIYTVLDNQPDLLLLKTGALDDTTWFRPQFHVWYDDKQHWVEFAEDARDSQASEP